MAHTPVDRYIYDIFRRVVICPHRRPREALSRDDEPRCKLGAIFRCATSFEPCCDGGYQAPGTALARSARTGLQAWMKWRDDTRGNLRPFRVPSRDPDVTSLDEVRTTRDAYIRPGRSRGAFGPAAPIGDGRGVAGAGDPGQGFEDGLWVPMMKHCYGSPTPVFIASCSGSRPATYTEKWPKTNHLCSPADPVP